MDAVARILVAPQGGLQTKLPSLRSLDAHIIEGFLMLMPDNIRGSNAGIWPR